MTTDRASLFVTPDWRLVAGRIWGILASRLTPQQIAALTYIESAQPITRQLAEHLGISEQQAGNVTRKLYDEGFLRREKAGKSYRWFSAFPHPFSLHRFDRRPLVLSGEAAQRARRNPQKEGQAQWLSRSSTGRTRR